MTAAQPLARPGTLRADAARNRAAVLDIARQRVANGVDGLAMNTIAKEAGVGVGTVYRHFPTTQVLLEALAFDSFERLVALAQAAAAHPDTRIALRDILTAGVQLQFDDPELNMVLASGELVCADTRKLGAALNRATTEIRRRGISAGLVSPKLKSEDIQHLVCGTAYAVRVSGRSSNLRPYVEVLLRGLAN